MSSLTRLVRARGKQAFLLGSALALTPGCESDPTAVDLRPADWDAINTFIEALPAWPQSVPAARPPAARSPVYLTQGTAGSTLDYRCGVSEKNLVRSFPKLLAAGSDLGSVYPGALLEGATVRSGRPVPLAVARAPMTIRINLPIAGQTREIPEVTASAVAQAIADLQITAADEQGVRDVVPADMVFELSEATSFNQSMVAVGVSLAYANPLSLVGAGGNLESSTTRAVRTHSVMVKFVQEMFTVRVADDQLPEPGDFFGQTASMADLNALAGQGRIGADNLPVYVESVTYGRVMFFSLRSTDVDTAEELRVAMQASGRGLSGTAGLTSRQREILSEATYQFLAYGGPQSAATAAIANLDWRRFFTPAAVTTAVPIAFTVKTLNTRETATIYDDVVFLERQGCEAPASYTVGVTLTRVERTGGFCLACVFIAEIRRSGVLPAIMRTGVFGPATGPYTFSDSRTVTLGPGQRMDVCSSFDTAALCAPFGYPGAVAASQNNLPGIPNGSTATRTSDVSALGAAGRFTYRVSKTANFP
jgi:hypothetical protein